MTKNIHQRLHAVMQKCDYLQREAKPGMRYKIVSHDKVTAYVRPALVENGVIYYPVAMTRAQVGNRTEIDLTLRFVNIDEPAEFVDVVGAGYGVDEQDKGVGKAISYAVKYCLLKALGLETGDDPDETQDEKANHRPPANSHVSATDPRARAEAIVKSIKAAPHIDALDSLMDTTMKERQTFPPATQQHFSKVYEIKREAMESVS